jgi:hypothetical protein
MLLSIVLYGVYARDEMMASSSALSNAFWSRPCALYCAIHATMSVAASCLAPAQPSCVLACVDVGVSRGNEAGQRAASAVQTRQLKVCTNQIAAARKTVSEQHLAVQG